ncbi:MAG: aldo/keto reductase [Planctomycetes bacterium]|nr:aldo/keto reductase [Planctomycetota bacterium]
MERIVLPGSDLTVSKLSLGTWSMSGSKNWGANDADESVRTIQAALDHGINFIDSAARYNDGEAERLLGRALKGRRAEAVVATKIYTDDLGYDDAIRECDYCLQRLDTDYIDLFQIHWPSRTIPFDETLRAFDTLKRDGKIRAVGICNAGPQSIAAVAGHAVTNQLPYNLLWRQIEDRILPDSQAAGLSVWPYCPLAQGLLTGKFRSIDDVPLPRREVRYYSGEWKQGRHTDTGFEAEIFAFLADLQKIVDSSGIPMTALALAFLKDRPGVGSVLIGARDRRQLLDNLAQFETPVPADVMAAVLRLSDALKPKMGTNPDMWENKDGGRMF